MTATKPAAAAVPCACQQFDAVIREITDEAGNMVDVELDSTGCTETTRRTFAPGHDAKLKGYLIRWEVAGYDIRQITGGVAVTRSAVDHAAQFGFAIQVANGVRINTEKAEARKAAADRKHEAKAIKTGQATKPAPTVEKVADEDQALKPLNMRVKVGRWEYDATIDGNTATYTDKQGNVKTTQQFVVVL